jgi:hypothetical protein
VANQREQHRWVVDAIEESVASIEVNGTKMITVPQAMLPKDAREGHVLCVTIEIDHAATKDALDQSAAQVKKHAKQPNDPGGDIAL